MRRSRRPSVAALAALAVVALSAQACTAPGAPSGGAVSGTAGCDLFPVDSIWHARVDGLAVHPSSAAWVASIGTDRRVHADLGSGLWDGGPIGIPHTTVPASQPAVPVTFAYASESDPGPYPIPSDAPIEGGAGADGDRHVIVVQEGTCRLHELYDARPTPGGWTAGSGATWDLRSHSLRPAGWTSADAAGLPILPGLVRYEEVAAGRIDHLIRFTAPRTQRAYVWPARHQAGASTDPSLPPMGAVFRLKASTDLSRFTGAARVIAEAMQRHGMILADNGSAWYFSGSPDPRWNNAELHQLDVLRGSDFEAVDTAPLMVSPHSGQART